MRSNLLTFFLLNFGLELVFLVVPLLLSFWEVRKACGEREREAVNEVQSFASPASPCPLCN